MKIIARNELDEEPLLQGLGPEPLGNEFDADLLARACHNKKTSLKAALLDQRVVAGLGNIYVCEALLPRASVAAKAGRDAFDQEARDHRSRQAAGGGDPHRAEPGDQGRRLVLRDHRQTSGELGYFQHSFQVYDREGEKCQTPALRRHHPPLQPERPLDLLVPEVPEIMRETPVIQTRRLILRPMALTDAPAIQRHFNNWNVIQTLATVVPWPYPDDGTETFIKRRAGPRSRPARKSIIGFWCRAPGTARRSAISIFDSGRMAEGPSRVLAGRALLEQGSDDGGRRGSE